MPSTIEQRQLAQRERQNVEINKYNDEAKNRQAPVQVAFPAADLTALTLSATTLASGASTGTVIGALSGKGADAVLSIYPADARFAINGNNLVKGSAAVTAGTRAVTVRQTSATSLTPVKDTTFNITVS